jgi:hypothetical protein
MYENNERTAPKPMVFAISFMKTACLSVLEIMELEVL